MELNEKEFISSLVTLVDAVTEIVEIYKSDNVHNQLWKEQWLKRARECLSYYELHRKEY